MRLALATAVPRPSRSRWLITAREFRPTSGNDCSIHSSPPRKAAQAWGCPSRLGSSKSTVENFATKQSCGEAQLLASFSHACSKMKPKILLIEDDASTGASLQKVLCAEGYDVFVCSRGDEGLERARGQSHDVVLTDLRLPGLGGLELVERLHADKPKQPIILMTAHGTTEIAIEATKLGACDYLLKPFEADELLDVVAKAVASSRLMSDPVELGEDR